VATAALSRPFFDPRTEKRDAIDVDPAFSARTWDPACHAAQLVSTGGLAPRDPHTLAVRWAGYSNFELAYGGKIILLDAYFDRGSNYPPLGFKARDVTRADVILIGHGHFDHMSDAIGEYPHRRHHRGAPVTTDKLAAQQVPATQILAVTGLGGELLKFDGFSVEPILARHGQPDPQVTTVMEGALGALSPEPGTAQEAEERAIRARGVSDPRVIGEGTIAYLIALDSGFRIIYRDSGGRVTDQEKAVMARAGDVDLALVAVAAEYLVPLTAREALEHMRLYRPEGYMRAHHGAPVAAAARCGAPPSRCPRS
jgi:L-ascorbate metabolism protein UlaG (beta-lactamase superfamily)